VQPLAGRVAWVTGGASGIGLAAAVALARAGAHVVVCGRNARTNEEGLARVREAGSAELAPLDVTDRAAVYGLAQSLAQRHGRIDILVASAGTNIAGPRRSLAALGAEDWDEVVAVNLNGVFYCAHAALPVMRARGDGLIVAVSSWAGRWASRLTGAAYNATKRAVLALVESINMEEGGRGVRATALLPGEVATPLLEKRPVPPPPEERARMVQPEDVAAAILFLATLPARCCVNELVLSPTWNRFYLGGLEGVPR